MSTQAPALDLTSCESEPIRIPGSIQPHGAIVVADPRTRTITRVSQNARAYFGHEARSILGSSLDELLGPALRTALDERLRAREQIAGAPVRLGVWTGGENRYCDCLVHERGGEVLVEFEALSMPGAITTDFSSQVIELVATLERANDFATLCGVVSRAVRELIEFDRVLIYRFDESWNGIVVGEAGNGRLPSYVDLRFPASDIPAQARELYRTNRSRVIPDAQYQPVPIVSADVDAPPLDMSFSTLRSVSPVHVEYMKNMGTPASASFSILRNGRLWGLIACHNSEPRMVRFNARRACELVAQTFALQVTALESTTDAERRATLNEIRSRLLAAMTSASQYADALLEWPEDFLNFAGASGAAVVMQESIRTVGQTPDEPAIRELVDWLSTHDQSEDVYATDSLAEAFAPAATFVSIAAGLLAISISRFHPSYVLWFRPEVSRTVAWAGDPRRAKTAGPLEAKLHPRVSFESWKETVRGRSHAWNGSELAAAAALRNDIVGVVLRRAEALAAVSQELERSNKELEAFSYSVSHDLRAPFRHIVGYSELIGDLESERLSERGKRYVQTVIDAGRMAGKLIDNLLQFSQMGRNSLNMLPIDMNQLVSEVRQEVVHSEGAGRRIEWDMQPLPPAIGDPNMLRLVLRNLLANAVKYTRKRDVAHIRITGREEADRNVYEIADNGAGFDMTYVEKLFGVFQRLHRVEDFEGTGIGLANVRRIISRHGGATWAVGRPGEGATFSFDLPKQGANPSISDEGRTDDVRVIDGNHADNGSPAAR